jgi:hypothetical protein
MTHEFHSLRVFRRDFLIYLRKPRGSTRRGTDRGTPHLTRGVLGIPNRFVFPMKAEVKAFG